MRIGVEMIGTQSASRDRGIGRYCRDFADALRSRGEGPGHEFDFYAVDGLPTDRIPVGPNAALRRLKPAPHLRYTLTRLVRENPDGLDALVITNPLELNPGNDVPARPPRGGGVPVLAAVVYDLIPLIFPEDYLARWPGTIFARRYLWALERLRTYDLLLAISESTRADLTGRLNVPAGKVVTVGTGGDNRVTRFEPGAAADPADLAALKSLGLDGPFVFSVAAADARKNLAGLIDAFALLPAPVRASHRLAVAAGMTADDASAGVFLRRAEDRGVRDALVLTGRVDDPTLRALYRGCAAFAFPSLYEGFGLPVLEALGCGAAVVAGRNSSLPEVAGDAAVLANAAEPASLASALASVLTDAPLARSLREKGPRQAREFRWDDVADRAIEAIQRLQSRPDRVTPSLTPGPVLPPVAHTDHVVDRLPENGLPFVGWAPPTGVATCSEDRWAEPTLRVPEGVDHLGVGGPVGSALRTELLVPDGPPGGPSQGRAVVGRSGPPPARGRKEKICKYVEVTPSRPRVALFSPLPPNRSGVAKYAEGLIGALEGRYAIDLFHDEWQFPFARFRPGGVGCFDHRMFARVDRARPYHAVVYQMGNSPAHLFVYEALLRRPGVVVLHDPSLVFFHYERSVSRGGGLEAFRRVLKATHPDRAGDWGPLLGGWSDAPGAMARGLVDAGLDMNRTVVALASAVVVHSREALGRLGPFAAAKAFVVPLGAEPLTLTLPPASTGRSGARARLGLPADALVVGSFGIVHPSKLNAEAIDAFAAVARAVPGAVFLVAGEEADGGLARGRAEALGLTDRVRFVGRPGDGEFLAAVAATDLGVALRRPPTHGESSAALLDLMRSGVATVVTDTGSFSEFPDGAVRKVRWESDAAGIDALTRALLELAADPAARAALGRAGLDHVRARHAWPVAAARYAEAIDWSTRVRPDAEAHLYRGPHRPRGGGGGEGGPFPTRTPTDRPAAR